MVHFVLLRRTYPDVAPAIQQGIVVDMIDPHVFWRIEKKSVQRDVLAIRASS